jgi:hypothetical protein
MMQNTTFADDTIAYNPNDYVDAGVAILPLPGIYRFRVTSLSRRKIRDTNEEVLRDGWPTLVLNRVEIVEPLDEAGTYAVFEEMLTKPYMRAASGGRKLPAAKHMDLLRAIDQHVAVSDFMEGVQEVERLLTSGATFVAQLGYRAQDTTWAKATIAEAGGKEALDRETYNKIWNDAKLTTKDFKNPQGGYRQQALGRSGTLLDAKLTLNKFIPSDQADTTALGPYVR